MKLLDRLLLWVLSVLAVVLGLLLILLVLFPSLGWLQVPAVRVVVGVLALIGILSAVAIHLRRATRQQGEAALVNDGENGSAYVTLSVISDMAKRIAQDSEGVRSCKSAVKNNGSGVDVELDMSLNPGVAVAPMAAMLQERLKNRILEMTGIHVGKVSILVEAAAEAKTPKQAPVEQLPSRVK
jgi:uncharacterized alkaline shock family protein YloU